MANGLARPAKPETRIQNMVNEAQRRFRLCHGQWLPNPRREFVFEGGNVRVTLHGEGLGHGPIANYEGPLGHWQANLSIRGCGKPSKIEAQP